MSFRCTSCLKPQEALIKPVKVILEWVADKKGLKQIKREGTLCPRCYNEYQSAEDDKDVLESLGYTPGSLGGVHSF